MKVALRKVNQRLALNVPCQVVDRVGGGEYDRTSRSKRESDQARTGNCERSIAFRGDLHDSTLAAEGSRNKEISVAIKRQTLRPAKSSIKNRNHALGIDLVYRVETRGRWTGNKKIPLGPDGQVVGGNAWFKRGEHKNLAITPNFEDCSAAVSDK